MDFYAVCFVFVLLTRIDVIHSAISSCSSPRIYVPGHWFVDGFFTYCLFTAIALSRFSITFPSSAPDSQQQQQPMPEISSSVLERIRRGKFINFDLLLPNNMPSETSNAFSLSLENSDFSTSPRLVVHNTNNSTREKVFDLHSWLLAWSLFLKAMIIFHGRHGVSQVMIKSDLSFTFSKSMHWTSNHDEIFVKEILLFEPWQFEKGTSER